MTAAATTPAGAQPVQPVKQAGRDAREERARPSVRGFAILFPQLLAIVALIAYAHPSFSRIACATVVGFALHYWVPFRFKEPFWFLVTFVGGAYMTSPDGSFLTGAMLVGLVFAAGLVIWAIVASPLPWWARASLVVGYLGLLVWAGTFGRALIGAPPRFYARFGAAFMFRILPYLYEARRFKTRARLLDFVRYFFVLPQWLLGQPILDFQRLGQSWYARSIDAIAQQGVLWIVRGMIQFAVYEVLSKHVYYAREPNDVRSVRLVAVHLLCVYGGYLGTSSIIHIFIGILKLFGYDLPECYRWYAFAQSPLDMWRRANIYWKDIMMKTVYLPLYFALRRTSDAGAKILALLVVFVVSWALHVWQLSWFSDMRHSPWSVAAAWKQEAMLWTVYAAGCVVVLALEIRAERTPKPVVPRSVPRAPLPPPAGMEGLVAKAKAYVAGRLAFPAGVHPARVMLQIAGTWTLIACLFSLERAPTWRAWLYTIKFWN